MTDEELKERVLKFCKNKTAIPKPKGTTILSVGEKNKEGQFQYTVGENGKKTVPFATLFACYHKLWNSKKYTRKWFQKEFEKEAKSSPCNFTTIGGIFVKLGMAEYSGQNSGKYEYL